MVPHTQFHQEPPLRSFLKCGLMEKLARASTLGTEYLPRGRGKEKHKDKSELPFIVIQVGYCTTLWAATDITVMQVGPLGVI